jgi:MFS family permease
MAGRSRWRLSVMMALVYAVQGSFWPVLAVHLNDLGIAGRDRGWIFATVAVGSLIMPLGAGQLVDRVMPTQRLLAFTFGLGSLFLVTLGLGAVSTSGQLLGLFLAYWMITAPTYVLSSTLAFRHLARPEQEFGGVRLWGTVGWMAVGWVVSAAMALAGTSRPGQGAYEAFWVAAAVSVLLSVYCLSLPDTPPLAVGRLAKSGIGDALDFVRRPQMAVYLLTAFGVSLTTPFVYQVMPSHLESLGLARRWVSTAMTLGQWPEIAMLAAMPWLLERMGYRATLTIGIGAWALRYASLVADPPLWVALAGIPLHGMGVACFGVCGQMYMDRQAPAHRRASAQALLTVITSGAGCLLGSLLAGEVAGRFQGDAFMVFLVPCVINVALLVYFCSGFRAESKAEDWAGAHVPARPLPHNGVRGATARVGNLVTEPADG